MRPYVSRVSAAIFTRNPHRCDRIRISAFPETCGACGYGVESIRLLRRCLPRRCLACLYNGGEAREHQEGKREVAVGCYSWLLVCP